MVYVNSVYNIQMEFDTSLIKVHNFIDEKHKDLIERTISGLLKPHKIHLQEVADLVWASGGTDEEIISAWLHDTVEDTSVTIEEVEKLFGKKVAEIVHGLTDLEEYKGLTIKERKAKQANRVRTENDSIKRVKLADQTSNVRGLAIDPTDSMTFDECRDYIHAAKAIAHECRGISPLLDELFEKSFDRAVKRYGEAI